METLWPQRERIQECVERLFDGRFEATSRLDATAYVSRGEALDQREALFGLAKWEPGLVNVSAPSLVFWGARDPACPVEFGERLGKSLRAAKFVKLDCNHWTVLQKPLEVAAALEEHWSAHCWWSWLDL